MEDLLNVSEMFTVACRNWSWLVLAMLLGVLVGWKMSREAPQQ